MILGSYIKRYKNDSINKFQESKNFNRITKFNDKFQKTSFEDVLFCGNTGFFDSFKVQKPQIVVLPNVSLSYKENVERTIAKFPKRWLNKLTKYRYKIILSPTINEAYKFQGEDITGIEFLEKEEPKLALSMIHHDAKGGNNFIVFCDKPPISEEYIESIINYEFSHGIVSILKLDESKTAQEKIKQDIKEIEDKEKVKKLKINEKNMLLHYFFGTKSYPYTYEILSDLFAWNLGNGYYGSGLVSNVKNPNLMRTLFPNTSKYLSKI